MWWARWRSRDNLLVSVLSVMWVPGLNSGSQVSSPSPLPTHLSCLTLKSFSIRKFDIYKEHIQRPVTLPYFTQEFISFIIHYQRKLAAVDCVLVPASHRKATKTPEQSQTASLRLGGKHPWCRNACCRGPISYWLCSATYRTLRSMQN